MRNIHGLVTRGSSVKRHRRTHWGAGFVKAVGILSLQARHAATKPKARSPMGFLLVASPVCGTSVAQGEPDPYTSTPKGSRWAKNRAGWVTYQKAFRELLGPFASLFNAMRRHGSSQHSESGPFSLREGSALLKHPPISILRNTG